MLFYFKVGSLLQINKSNTACCTPLQRQCIQSTWIFLFHTAGQAHKIEMIENREPSTLFHHSEAKTVWFPTDFSKRPPSHHRLSKHHYRTSLPSPWKSCCQCIGWFLLTTHWIHFFCPWEYTLCSLRQQRWYLDSYHGRSSVLCPLSSLPAKLSRYLIHVDILCTLFN